MDNSVGFRPGRSPHDALTAVQRGLLDEPVNYVLDADIRRFFDSVDHEKMLRALAVRIADKRVLGLIERWLKVGVLKGDGCEPSEAGTPQGAPISPLLANIYLHYALDKWVLGWQAEPTRGPMIFVRYADDFIMGFKRKSDGDRMLADLGERMAQCGLALHEGKTRLIEFGRFAAGNRSRRGERRPETFDFLGFTHYCSETRRGHFMVKRKTQSKRLRRKLKELRAEAWRRMHEPVKSQHRWLCQVLRGHYAYYGLPGNSWSLYTFLREVRRLWYRALRRRDQKRRLNWARFEKLLEHFTLPTPGELHTSGPVAAGVR